MSNDSNVLLAYNGDPEAVRAMRFLPGGKICRFTPAKALA
jgi:hypothetical protein